MEKRNFVVWIFFALFFCLLLGCTFREKRKNYTEDMQNLCSREIKQCFGTEYEISEGMEREDHYYDEKRNTNVIVRDTEWNITYRDVQGEEQTFVFNNRCEHPKSHWNHTVESYIAKRVSDFYQQKFIDCKLKGISGYREKDSGEEERRLMREETKERLRDILGEMAGYTDGSLNATVYVIMMDENGFADDFFLTVLKGEELDGESLVFEKILHENFFGKILYGDILLTQKRNGRFKNI
ncbi:MAG: hypothetical protein K2P76_10375 [Lachnospiraceae bacterium]|nr:hypothetical protein [Lachnospiraceae bacterium]MDE6982074.1 hypothetical protein [Lachnospiraceae bacterium]